MKYSWSCGTDSGTKITTGPESRTLSFPFSLHADGPPRPHSHCLLCNELQMWRRCKGVGWWGGCLACHVLRRGETLSEGTLSALMEWLVGPPGAERLGGRSGVTEIPTSGITSGQAGPWPWKVRLGAWRGGGRTGLRGGGGWHWTYHSQGSVGRKTSRSWKKEAGISPL